MTASPNRFRYYLGGISRRADEHNLFLMAAGLAFTVLICIVPLVLILFFILGHVLDVGDLELRLGNVVDTFIPYENPARFFKELLIARAHEIIANRGTAGLVGTLGLLFAASGLFSSMRTVLNTVFQTTNHKNEFVAKVRDFVMVFAVICAFLVMAVAAPVIEALARLAPSSWVLEGFVFAALGDLLYSGLSLLVVFATLYALYHFVTYEGLRPRVVAVSALCATCLWELATEAFGYYVAEFGSIKRIYGTYALGAIGIFWIYYACIIVIVAAEVGQLYRERLESEHE